MNSEQALERAIEMLMEAHNYPLANTPEQHIERAQRRYELVHMASEILVLDVVDGVRFEGDLFMRNVGYDEPSPTI